MHDIDLEGEYLEAMAGARAALGLDDLLPELAASKEDRLVSSGQTGSGGWAEMRARLPCRRRPRRLAAGEVCKRRSRSSGQLCPPTYLPCPLLPQELFCASLRSGYVRTVALKRGSAGQPLVPALLTVMTQACAGAGCGAGCAAVPAAGRTCGRAGNV